AAAHNSGARPSRLDCLRPLPAGGNLLALNLATASRPAFAVAPAGPSGARRQTAERHFPVARALVLRSPPVSTDPSIATTTSPHLTCGFFRDLSMFPRQLVPSHRATNPPASFHRSPAV